MARAPHLRLSIQSASGRRAGALDLVQAVLAEQSAGRLPPGARMPPVRALEHQLGISKNTVQAAYDELCQRGVLEARSRAGVFVRQPDDYLPPPERDLSAPAPHLNSLAVDHQARLASGDTYLSAVFVDPELLPHKQLSDCIRSVLSLPGLPTFYDAQGYPPLRELIAARLCARGIRTSADEVLVTTGSQQALDVVSRALAPRCIAFENPIYRYARLLFEAHNLRLVPLDLDPFESIDFATWERDLANNRPGLMYAITSFQNPTGHSYSSHELERLLELAQRLDFALLEDDWGSDMLSENDYRPSLRALGGENVLYVNSFTKKLLPSLRLGYVLCSRVAMPALLAAKRLATLGNATLMEAALAEFLDRGYYDTHLNRVQKALDERYHACLDALEELMPEGVRWTTPGGGPILWLSVPDSVNLPALAARMAEQHIRIELMPQAFVGRPHLHGFPIGYAFYPPERLRAALECLSKELSRA
ncbi:MAG: PLP-dependent aminotransferase family protein [Polyangiaceae bacterium]